MGWLVGKAGFSVTRCLRLLKLSIKGGSSFVLVFLGVLTVGVEGCGVFSGGDIPYLSLTTNRASAARGAR